jgi:hypothetical protein
MLQHRIPSCHLLFYMAYQDSRYEGTGNDQLSIDLIDGAAAVCYVTSEELKYMMWVWAS